MAKKRPTPLLTHTEILCMAIRCCEHAIATWDDRGISPEHRDFMTAEIREKLEILKELYRIETGTEY